MRRAARICVAIDVMWLQHYIAIPTTLCTQAGWVVQLRLTHDSLRTRQGGHLHALRVLDGCVTFSRADPRPMGHIGLRFRAAKTDRASTVGARACAQKAVHRLLPTRPSDADCSSRASTDSEAVIRQFTSVTSFVAIMAVDATPMSHEVPTAAWRRVWIWPTGTCVRLH